MSPGDWIVWRAEFLDHVSYRRAQVENVGSKTVLVKIKGAGNVRVPHSTIVFAGDQTTATCLYLELATSKRQYDIERKKARDAHIERCNAIIAAAKR